MRSVPTHRCSSGSHQRLEYIVRDLLWSNPDAYVHNGYTVSKGFIDCTAKPLSAPFRKGSKVIVLCGTPVLSFACLPPAEATPLNVRHVQQFVAELRSRQIDPVLLQIHERLLDDAAVIRKSEWHVPGAFTVNGEVVRPLLFSGEVTWIAPVPLIHTVTVPRMMDIEISRVLLGDDRQPQIRVACRSNICSGAAVGSKTVGYCHTGRARTGDCFISVTVPEMSIPVVKQWIVESGAESKSDSDFEDLHGK